MKKNGRKHRKQKREIELKKNSSEMMKINQEVEGINTAFLSMSQIISENPIINDSPETKNEYIKRLKGYLKSGGFDRRKFESSQITAYEKIITEEAEIKEVHDIEYYKYFILFDLLHILGYETQKIPKVKIQAVEKQYLDDFPNVIDGHNAFNRIIKSVHGNGKRLSALAKEFHLKNEADYIKLMIKNINFKKKEPYGILVTATMSAGKSTFINALTGKYICLSQNMACTSKIHSIVNKAFEDGYSYEYDYDLVMTAGREELLNDNELNNSDKIVVSTSFNGVLRDKRVIVSDSPGVNFSGDKEHKKITDRLITGRNYNLLVYVMNATQLATDDEDEHLEFVKQAIGRTPVIFVINKIDSYNIEEEDVIGTIQRQIQYLEKKGFKNPIVCPVSSRAGYLAKQYQLGSLSEIEENEFRICIKKLKQMELSRYYNKYFENIKIPNSDKKDEQLLKTSGLAYVERIIDAFIKGGKINGTGLY
jgi:GTP-binding protein EngB required for normal cell division